MKFPLILILVVGVSGNEIRNCLKNLVTDFQLIKQSLRQALQEAGGKETLLGKEPTQSSIQLHKFSRVKMKLTWKWRLIYNKW